MSLSRMQNICSHFNILQPYFIFEVVAISPEILTVSSGELYVPMHTKKLVYKFKRNIISQCCIRWMTIIYLRLDHTLVHSIIGSRHWRIIAHTKPILYNFWCCNLRRKILIYAHTKISRLSVILLWSWVIDFTEEKVNYNAYKLPDLDCSNFVEKWAGGLLTVISTL